MIIVSLCHIFVNIIIQVAILPPLNFPSIKFLLAHPSFSAKGEKIEIAETDRRSSLITVGMSGELRYRNFLSDTYFK